MTDPVLTSAPPPLDLDLGPARQTASRWVADGVVPCAAIGVIDAAGRLRCDFVPSSEGTIDLRTVFFLASLTKGIVATAVMRYVDEARLDLEAPLARYLPEWEHIVCRWQQMKAQQHQLVFSVCATAALCRGPDCTRACTQKKTLC